MIRRFLLRLEVDALAGRPLHTVHDARHDPVPLLHVVQQGHVEVNHEEDDERIRSQVVDQSNILVRRNTKEPTEPDVTEPAPDAPGAKGEAEIARGVLAELLTLMGIKKAQVDVRQAEPAAGEKDPPLVLDVHGPDTDVLVGRRGKTMAALQHITRLIVGREMGGWVHLVIDVDGFKARREKSLHRLAHRMAEQALSTNRTVRLEPMPPHERRIIHLALRDYPNVTTESIGDGDRRKVTIIPR